jgi:hypothetical protein
MSDQLAGVRGAEQLRPLFPLAPGFVRGAPDCIHKTGNSDNF